MADLPPDPHAEDWERAVKNGSYQNRSGLIVAGAAVTTAVGVLGAWMCAYSDETYVYAGTGKDASWAIIKRGIMLAGLAALVVALILIRVLDVRENAYTKGISALLKR
jgi:hypothetical protein